MDTLERTDGNLKSWLSHGYDPRALSERARKETDQLPLSSDWKPEGTADSPRPELIVPLSLQDMCFPVDSLNKHANKRGREPSYFLTGLAHGMKDGRLLKPLYALIAAKLLLADPNPDIWGGRQQINERGIASNNIVRVDRLNHMIAVYNEETKTILTLYSLNSENCRPPPENFYLRSLFSTRHEDTTDLTSEADIRTLVAGHRGG
ncbi:MAG: hypothetical protein EOO38_26040 [Cytophagaceae bacterium]|nr:MAG: hypothetical protein EOO38_26040 [Cytophagaceae bacterium]